jgi:hypothetical protein
MTAGTRQQKKDGVSSAFRPKHGSNIEIGIRTRDTSFRCYPSLPT